MIQFNFVVNLLFIAIFFTNRIVPAQTALSKTGKITVLPEDDRENVFASQILQIRTTSEATPAASAGNNLNAVRIKVPSSSLNPQKNFQEIPINYEMENRKLTSNETVERGERNLDFLMQFDESISNKKESSILLVETSKATNTLPLVSDNCMEMNIKNSEISFTDNDRNLVKIPNDAEFLSDELQISDDKGHFDIEDENKNKRNAINTHDEFTIENDANKNKNTYLYQNEGNNNNTEKDSTNTVITVDKLLKDPTLSTSTDPADLIPMQPLTTLLYRDVPETLNVTLFDIVTEKNARTGYGEDWFEVKNRNKIRFDGLPQSENYLIPTLKLEEGFYPFKFMSEFFSLIYPFDFPVGLIKDILWGKFNFPYSFLQSIKVESTFLGFIVFFSCIALVIPSYLCILGVMVLCSGSRNESDAETGALFPESRETDCSDRVLIFMTLLIVLMCCTLISGMIISNEQAQTAATESRRVIQCACSDIYTWLAAAAREINHSIVPPAEVVVHAFNEDLMDVERLLGEPIKQAISSESGVDLVLDSLADIVAESEDLSTKISSLRDVSAQASALASVATEKIKDLTRQLDNLKRHCVKADEQLCDTINSHYLELKMKFTLILQEKQLLRLRTLGVVNLTQAIESARKQFRTLPFGISNQTAHIRKDILEHIKQRCKIVHTSSQILRDIARHLTAGLQTIRKRLESGVNRVQKIDFWRWILMLACSFLFCLVMLLIVCATICGCGNAKIHAKRTLQASSLCLCMTSLVLWTVISAIFLFAGHIEVYICHALWDKPHYLALSSLLDRPSPLFTMNEGIFDAIFRDLNNITMDVSVRDVLRDCEMNRPAYIVFQLDKILDVNKETSYFEWDDLQTDFGRLSTMIDVSFLKTTSVNFSKLLNDVLVISDVNLAKYRIDYNGPLVGKDLPSLVDQLENIAAKVSDLNTAGRLETLATRTQRLLISSIRPMEQLRTDLVYKLTELELQLLPFRKKLNISLSHIHTAQYYIDNQGDVIAQKKVSTYISRLISHAASWRTHVLTSVGQRAARCRPLYDVYEAARSLLCTRYVASLHGWWVCGFLLGLLWCSILTPLCVRLWRIYRYKIGVHDSMALSNINSAQQGTPTTTVCDDNWNSPEPPPPPNEENW